MKIEQIHRRSHSLSTIGKKLDRMLEDVSIPNSITIHEENLKETKTETDFPEVALIKFLTFPKVLKYESKRATATVSMKTKLNCSSQLNL